MKMSKLQMFPDQKSCDGGILDEEMARESGLTYLNLRCDDTRKVSIEQILYTYLYIQIMYIYKGRGFQI